MTISSIGSSNYYMGQMSAMGSRYSSAEMSGQMGPNAAMGNGPDRVEIFNKVDEDGSGGLDQTEFQTLADKISEVTGQDVDVEELFATYDADGDNVLSQEETDAAMEANRPQGPPPGGMMGGMGGMQGGAPPDLSQIFTDADEDEDGSLNETEAQSLAEIISQATGEEVDVAELLAANDTDEDGVLSEEETIAALEANRPQGPPPEESAATPTEGNHSVLAAGIERYVQFAALGMEQREGNSGFATFGGNGNGNGNSVGWLNSVNTWT